MLEPKALETAQMAFQERYNRGCGEDEIACVITTYLAALVPADVQALVERLEKRAKEDRDCADNNRTVADLLSPELAKFNERDEAGWNTYAVRMALDHRSAMERDRRYASDLCEAASTLLSLSADPARMEQHRNDLMDTIVQLRTETARLRSLIDEKDRALDEYAEPRNWVVNGRFDPHSGNFDGTSFARAVRTKGGDNAAE